MTNLRQAAQQALEALCSAVEPKKGKVYAREFEPIDCFAMHEQAITAIKEALTQDEKSSSQKPVATMKMLHTYGDTTPPKRPWVGLTDDERLELYRQFEDCLESDDWEYEKAIEDKLKERNHG